MQIWERLLIILKSLHDFLNWFLKNGINIDEIILW